MQKNSLVRVFAALALGLAMAFAAGTAMGQGTAGSISGTVADSTGAVVPGATVTISDPVSGYTRTATSDSTGKFRFFNVPFNPYKVTVTEKGFQQFNKNVDLASGIEVTVPVALALATANSVVTVDAPVELVETDSSAHTDIDGQRSTGCRWRVLRAN
jgi:curli biogenesis system outer membrane secretion channel CsgG